MTIICLLHTVTLVKSHNPLFGHRQDLHTRGGSWTNMAVTSHYPQKLCPYCGSAPRDLRPMPSVGNAWGSAAPQVSQDKEIWVWMSSWWMSVSHIRPSHNKSTNGSLFLFINHNGNLTLLSFPVNKQHWKQGGQSTTRGQTPDCAKMAVQSQSIMAFRHFIIIKNK